MTYHYDNPPPRNSWLPAEQYCPELVARLMHMGDVTYSGIVIQQYKHRDPPRRYINLDETGQAWQIVVDPETGGIGARHITLDEAKRHVLGEGNVS